MHVRYQNSVLIHKTLSQYIKSLLDSRSLHETRNYSSPFTNVRPFRSQLQLDVGDSSSYGLGHNLKDTSGTKSNTEVLSSSSKRPSLRQIKTVVTFPPSQLTQKASPILPERYSESSLLMLCMGSFVFSCSVCRKSVRPSDRSQN